jgi:hypothetical protein
MQFEVPFGSLNGMALVDPLRTFAGVGNHLRTSARSRALRRGAVSRSCLGTEPQAWVEAVTR